VGLIKYSFFVGGLALPVGFENIGETDSSFQTITRLTSRVALSRSAYSVTAVASPKSSAGTIAWATLSTII
jgi:hypothetical protein